MTLQTLSCCTHTYHHIAYVPSLELRLQLPQPWFPVLHNKYWTAATDVGFDMFGDVQTNFALATQGTDPAPAAAGTDLAIHLTRYSPFAPTARTVSAVTHADKDLVNDTQGANSVHTAAYPDSVYPTEETDQTYTRTCRY